MHSIIKELGILRICLITLALVTAFLPPTPGTPMSLNGWQNVITTLVAPAMAPLVFMVLLFDFMMCRIRMSDESVRHKFKKIGYIELAVALFLFITWLPFFLEIGG